MARRGEEVLYFPGLKFETPGGFTVPGNPAPQQKMGRELHEPVSGVPHPPTTATNVQVKA